MAKLTIFTAIFVVFISAFCLAAPPSGRIVGGENARQNQFPFQISLRRRGSHTCGGSIYNEKYIITAAHCISNSAGQVQPAGDYTVVAGTNTLNNGGVTVQVKRIIKHENYGNFKNDIALLELAQPLKLSASIQPIQIHNGNVQAGAKVTISGWGRVYTGGPISNELKFNTMSAIPQPECGREIGMKDAGLICLGHSSNNGACNGDSGGPAILDGKLLGVANFVISGCGSRNPDGYALVPHFLKWIKSKAV